MEVLSLIISGYTDKDEQNGLYRATLDAQTAKLNIKPLNIALKHPSYFDYCNHRLTVISEVLETQSPTICQYQFVNDKATLIAKHALSGSTPCYVERNTNLGLVATAQYGTGHVDIFSSDNQGIIAEHIQTIDSQALAGSEEVESHAHQAMLLSQSRELITVDLGCDCVRIFPFDPTTNAFTTSDSYSLTLDNESGPRHAVFTKDETFGLVLCEISEQLITLHKVKNKWQVLHSQPALPDTDNGQAAGAIKFSPDERFVYVTGRRQNLISFFAFDGQTGECTHQFSIDCGGEFARDFAISEDGAWLVIANQFSHNLAVFKRNNQTGELQDTNVRHKIPSPTCVKFV
ncbi:lactonase family protein [Vibrio gangliei]|uniref:lactonase family protein n=1 Tax=Vibrio gangliei TaxID=2077090 RepID=UPI000D01A3A2|nr:beta-propeller fold lactonase family protein [Vibrio gangliei]